MKVHAHTAPLALASDGAILVNVHHLYGDTDPQRLLDLALGMGRPVFIAILAEAKHSGQLVAELDDAATLVASRILAAHTKR